MRTVLSKHGCLVTLGVILFVLALIYQSCATLMSPAIMTSTDGINWRLQHVRDDMSGITYANDRFVAVGRNGSILVSRDGDRWKRMPSGTDKLLSAVTYGGGQFVAVGEGGTILTSPDGSQWQDHSLSYWATEFHGVAFGNGRYVAVGKRDGIEGEFFTSRDGITWTGTYDTRNGVNAVAYGNGRFVAVTMNNILVSADGVDWKEHSVLDDPSGVANENGMFVMNGFRAFYTSTDGDKWTKLAVGDEEGAPDRVTRVNGELLLIGNRVMEEVFFTSRDGLHWQKRNVLRHRVFRSLTYGKGQFVATAYYELGIH